MSAGRWPARQGLHLPVPRGVKGAAARGQHPARGLQAGGTGLTVGGDGVAGLGSPPPLRAGERAVSLRVGAEAKVPGLTGGRKPPPPAAAAL